jgi:FlaA1/EpsC-like NDP-sugar epimerase
MQVKNDETIVTLIVGAGDAGRLIAENILSHTDSGVEIAGFVDDDPKKSATKHAGIDVLGTLADIPEIVKKKGVEELLFAIPSQRGSLVRDIVTKTAGLGLAYKILPRASEVLHQDYDEDYMRYIRKVRAEDLLGGEILKSDQKGISDFTEGKTVMVTGAAGSIGSELCRQLASYGVKKAIFYDWWENGVFDLRNQLLEMYPDVDYEFIIGDVKDRRKLDSVIGLHKPHTIFHAAAYKHVPLMESNPAEAVKNNILGTKTVGELAIKHGVEKFILVSTDKAVNPTNIMGATKRAAEKMIHILAGAQTTTTFCAVRFGNVINSNGSAIPFFLNQIAKGGPVTVTHRDITRFFMTIPEAVHLILQAWTIGENNDLFVLDMGESVKIYDLAETLIALEGYIPNQDIKIKIVGLRPGEKLYEEVLMDQEGLDATSIKKVFRTKNYMNFEKASFLIHLQLLLDALEQEGLNVEIVKNMLKKIVTTYKPTH